ncbi:MAG: ubiquinone/menaquinone biosynthesis C-methylase UbiE [Gammaproteobacteria bacterium]
MKNELPYKFVPAGLSLDEHIRQREAKAEKILRILQNYVVKLKNKSLLDVGCHEGTITKFLAPSFTSATGMDIDSGIIDIAQKLNGENVDFVTYDGKKFPFDNNLFDVLVVNHVIYYVQNPQEFLKEVKRVLKPGGVCYLSSTNVAFVEPPLLLPKNMWCFIRRRLLKSADNYGHPCGYNQYLKMFEQFQVEDFTFELLMHPRKYATDITGWQKLILLCVSCLPGYVLKKVVKLSPTYVYLLFNRELTESRINS